MSQDDWEAYIGIRRCARPTGDLPCGIHWASFRAVRSDSAARLVCPWLVISFGCQLTMYGRDYLFNFFIGMTGNPPKGRSIGGGRDQSAPTDVRVILLQVIITPYRNPSNRSCSTLHPPLTRPKA